MEKEMPCRGHVLRKAKVSAHPARWGSGSAEGVLLLEPLTLHVLPRLPKPHEGKYKQKLERNLSPSQHLAGDGQRLRAGVRVQAGVDWGFPLRCPYSAWLGAR